MKVGLWEPGYPNYKNPYLAFNAPSGAIINENNCDNTFKLLDTDCDIGDNIRDPIDAAFEDEINFRHATYVAGIMLIHNENDLLRAGAAKDITLYAGSYGRDMGSEQFALDWLVKEKGVDVIVSSAGDERPTAIMRGGKR